MGAAVSPLSVAIITAAWLVLVPTALAGVAAIVAAGGPLVALDGVCALVRGAVGIATGSLMGDVLEPEACA